MGFICSTTPQDWFDIGPYTLVLQDVYPPYAFLSVKGPSLFGPVGVKSGGVFGVDERLRIEVLEVSRTHARISITAPRDDRICHHKQGT
jgi:hypothetical protein